MTRKFASLVPVTENAPPWLYAMDTNACIDLAGFTSREDWETKRRDPILRWTKRYRLAGKLVWALSAALGVLLVWPDVAPAWVPAAAVITLSLALVNNVFAFLRLRGVQENMVVAAPAQELHSEILLLGRTLVAVNALKHHAAELPGVHLPNVDRVDPEAMAALAKSLLLVKFPHVDADYVRSVRTDIAAGLHKATGVRLNAD